MGGGLHELSARRLAEAIAGRRVSAVDALAACLARIDARNPALNAVVSLDEAGARAAAVAADAAIAAGELRLGCLHGVPITLKDGHDVAGMRTTAGTPALDRIADADGAVAARLRGAGAIVVGHTNVPPWLADYQSANPIFGVTANPWDPARTPGGSSGGAAAALAAGMTPLEIGSDLAGSLRLPASFCGVYGLKTTEHRVPATGFLRPPGGGPRPVRIAASLGPMARDLDDLELALRLISGPDGHDGDVPPVPLATAPPQRLDGVRIAVAPALPGVVVARAVRAEVGRLAARIADAGADVVDALPALDWQGQHELFADIIATITGIFDPAAQLREEQRTLAWYLRALDQRDRVIAAWEAFFARGVDALILPAAMTPAFAHRPSGGSVEVDGIAVPYHAHGGPLVCLNLAGLPGLAVPAGQDDDGLPIGVQIVGPRWSEMRLLELARELERVGALPGYRAPPPPPPG
jgi:amidase